MIETIAGLNDWIDRARHRVQTAKLPVQERKSQLRSLVSALHRHEEHILGALFCDLGKSDSEAYLTEIMPILSEARIAIKHLDQWAKARRGGFSMLYLGSKARVEPEPYGVVLIISPWNYPLNLVLCPMISALAAGNAVLISPSPSAPHTKKALVKLIEETFPNDSVAIIDDAVVRSGKLLGSRYDYIFYTGGVEYAYDVMRGAAEYLTPLTLELGGKSPCIVGEEADLHLSAKRIAWGKTLNAGQTCVAPDYVLVHKSVENILIQRLIYYFNRFYGHDAILSPSYARMIRPDAVKRMKALLEGGELLYGGQTESKYRYVAPTLVRPLSARRAMMREEIFGPILPVIAYDHIEEAIAHINARPKPLALYYFGAKKNMRRILSVTSSGSAVHNDVVMQVAHPGLPFGGVGLSGMGNYHGKAGFDTFSHYRSILYSSRMFDPSLRYPPYRSLRSIKRLFRFVGR